MYPHSDRMAHLFYPLMITNGVTEIGDASSSWLQFAGTPWTDVGLRGRRDGAHASALRKDLI